MSGIKETYVQLTTTQRDTMLRQCREAQDEAARLRERALQLESANREAQSKITTLDNKINTQIRGLTNEIREIEREQNASFRNALEKQGADIRREMQEQKQELTRIINNIVKQINEREHGKQQRAVLWASQAEAFINEIDKYRHELFTPNRLQMLRTRLQQAQNSITAGDFEAAISSAQECFNGAVILRSDVIEAEFDWIRCYDELSQRYDNLSRAINDAKLLRHQIGEKQVDAKIDYWTNGALREMETHFLSIKENLKNPNNISRDELVSMSSQIDNMIDHLNNPQTGIIISSYEALMLSVYRSNMVEDIANILSERGWNLDDYTYRGSEQKNDLYAKITDGTGNELVVIIEPQTNQGKLENKLTLNFFNDKEFDESSMNRRISNMRNDLSEHGIKLDLRCVEGYERKPSDRKEIRNLDQIRVAKNEN